MEYTYLSGSGLRVSRICFGCYTIGGYDWGAVSDSESISAIESALDNGINFFDTASIYGLGHSETVLGTALRGRSENLVVATKCGLRWDSQQRRVVRDCRPAAIRESVEMSLQRLQLETIPLCFVHYPDEATLNEETFRCLSDLVSEGKIQYVGVSNFSAHYLEQALAVLPIVAVQCEMNLASPYIESRLERLCHGRSLSIVPYGALAQGLFSGKFSEDSKFPENDVRRRHPNFIGLRFRKNLKTLALLKSVAAQMERTPAQVAIRWTLDHPDVAASIVGFRNADQVNAALGAVDWRLSPEHFDLLRASAVADAAEV